MYSYFLSIWFARLVRSQCSTMMLHLIPTGCSAVMRYKSYGNAIQCSNYCFMQCISATGSGVSYTLSKYGGYCIKTYASISTTFRFADMVHYASARIHHETRGAARTIAESLVMV